MTASSDPIRDDPEGGPIIRRVEETFQALTKVRNRQSRVRKPEAIAAAAVEYKAADQAYRKAAAARDRFVETFRKRRIP